jgi:hypothetical protein
MIQELVVASKRFWDAGEKDLSRCVGALVQALDIEDYEEARSINQQMILKHNHTLTVLSGQHWNDAVFGIVPMKPDTVVHDFNMSGETKAAQPKVSNEKTPYTIHPYGQLFGGDAFGVCAPSGETIAFIKTKERAELIVQLLEQAAGDDMLKRWTAHFETRFAEHGDRVRAATEADIEFGKQG